MRELSLVGISKKREKVRIRKLKLSTSIALDMSIGYPIPKFQTLVIFFCEFSLKAIFGFMQEERLSSDWRSSRNNNEIFLIITQMKVSMDILLIISNSDKIYYKSRMIDLKIFCTLLRFCIVAITLKRLEVCKYEMFASWQMQVKYAEREKHSETESD